MTYSIRYRQPGQFLWRKLKRVKGDGFVDGVRYFLLENDTLRYVSKDAEVDFPPERQAVITKKMSAEIGQPVQRA